MRQFFKDKISTANILSVNVANNVKCCYSAEPLLSFKAHLKWFKPEKNFQKKITPVLHQHSPLVNCLIKQSGGLA